VIQAWSLKGRFEFTFSDGASIALLKTVQEEKRLEEIGASNGNSMTVTHPSMRQIILSSQMQLRVLGDP
jgi:hypothetical protein